MKITKYSLTIGKLTARWGKNGSTCNGNGWNGFYIQISWLVGNGDDGSRNLMSK